MAPPARAAPPKRSGSTGTDRSDRLAGGVSASGGATGSGGTGAIGAGGSGGTGNGGIGAIGAGGSKASGGATGSGGAPGSGGTLATGGNKGSGGSGGRGGGGAAGNKASGGATGSGGAAQGGSTGSGGTSGTAGAAGGSAIGGGGGHYTNLAVDLCAGMVADKQPHPMTTLAKPALGASRHRPRVRTRPSAASPRSAAPARTPAIVPMYSTISAWNADESLLILYAGRRRPPALRRQELRAHPRARHQPGRRRAGLLGHHRPGPPLLHRRAGVHPLPRQHRREGRALHDFCVAVRVETPTNGDDPMFTSWDSHRLGLTCGQKMFIYDWSTDTVLGPATASGTPPAQVAPSGTLAYLEAGTGAGPRREPQPGPLADAAGARQPRLAGPARQRPRHLERRRLRRRQRRRQEQRRHPGHLGSHQRHAAAPSSGRRPAIPIRPTATSRRWRTSSRAGSSCRPSG